MKIVIAGTGKVGHMVAAVLSESSVWRETRLIRRHSGGPESVRRTLW